MAQMIASIPQRLRDFFWTNRHSDYENLPDFQPAQTEQKTSSVVAQVLAKKREHKQTALENTLERYSPIWIGGDIFNTGYLGLQGAQSFFPALQGVAAIGMATLVCGMVGGVINIGVGLYSLKLAIDILKKGKDGDRLLAARLLLDFVGCTAIGVIMILVSLTEVGLLGGIGAFFTANPWVLPILFFAISIPLLIELSYRIGNVALARDLGSKLQLDQLKNLLEQTEPDWGAIEELIANPEHPLYLQPCATAKEEVEFLSNKMEQLQAGIGTTAAIETFALLEYLQARKKDEALAQLAIAEQKIKEWNRSLYTRMFQQVLYAAGFAISMCALMPQANVNLLNGTQNALLAIPNGIALGMDTFWPFKRNGPLGAPEVTTEQILGNVAS